MRVSELEGAELDLWVARAMGKEVTFGKWGTYHYGAIIKQPVDIRPNQTVPYSPSTDWSQGGPLLDEFRVDLSPLFGGGVRARSMKSMGGPGFDDEKALPAAMRAVVASVYGEEVPSIETEEGSGYASE